MRSYSLTHLSDAALLRDLATLIARDRMTTAAVLAHIAEVDARRLYAPAGYPSMLTYCVGELRLSDDAAFRRIRAARAGREFPGLFAALADGRLHLAAVCLLAPHLNRENADELIDAATHRRKYEIEEMFARRTSCGDVVVSPRAIHPSTSGVPQLVLGRVGSETSNGNLDENGVGTPDSSPSAPRNGDHSPAAMAAPLPERLLLKLTIARSTHEKLRYAQALLSHAVPSGDVAQVLDRALDALIAVLERRKLGVVTRRQPQPSARTRRRLAARRASGPSIVMPAAGYPRPTVANRYIPAQVRRAVWERDQGRCTFVSAAGHRCESRRFLEFDHIDPVARGGRATVDGMRLRCRTHNQYEAERIFGAGFMSQRRHEARLAAVEARARAARDMPRGMLEETDALKATDAKEEAAREQIQDAMTGLRNLGFRADEARRAAALTASLQDVTLEERLRAALMSLGRR